MLGFTAFLILAAWGYLLGFRGFYWRAKARLDPAPDPEIWPEVVAVIPARNEAATIGAVVKAHLASDYPGDFSLVLVDDHSSDGTADIARSAIGDSTRAIDVVESKELPAGWTGKLWAVHQGLERARGLRPHAKYVLLADADIRLSFDALRRLVAKAEQEDLSLASLMARLDARGVWGGLLVPAFVYFFQMLYPFPRANDVNDNVAAAAGGCMLARADALSAVGGVQAFKGALIDDCALARAIKDLRPASKIWLGLADSEAISLRDNRPLSSIWNMVARTAYAQLQFSSALLAMTALGMALVFLGPAFMALSFAWHRDLAALSLAIAAWGLMAASYWPTLKLYRQEPWQAALLPFAAAFYGAMTISSAVRHWRGRGGAWKGRHY